MSAGQKIPLAEARELAAGIVKALAPACERIEVAGSIRRCVPEVGDIEIVAIPKRMTDFLGMPGDSRLLNERLAWAWAAGMMEPIKGGDRYKQFWIHRETAELQIKLDLFICERETWGVIFALRTGPAEFSRRLVTPMRQDGLLPSYMRVKDGRAWDGDGCLHTPEERDFFAALGMEWIDPKDRH
jgi:DNA polymerase/3'-5' exonuclease PolX